jgi:hypothetical protein
VRCIRSLKQQKLLKINFGDLIFFVFCRSRSKSTFFGATFHFPDFIVDVSELLVALDEVDEVVGGRVVGRDRLTSQV